MCCSLEAQKQVGATSAYHRNDIRCNDVDHASQDSSPMPLHRRRTQEACMRLLVSRPREGDPPSPEPTSIQSRFYVVSPIYNFKKEAHQSISRIFLISVS